MTLKSLTRLLPALLIASLALTLALAAPAAWAADIGTLAGLGRDSAAKSGEPLPPDVVFTIRPEATAPDRIEVRIGVHKDYYLYRSRLKFEAPEGQPVSLGTAALPKGEIKSDEYFGEQEVYLSDFIATIPVVRGSREAFTLPLKISWQGCWEGGLCYLPTTKTFDIEMPAATAVAALPAGGGGGVAGTGGGYVSEQDSLAGMIRGGNIFAMTGLFFLAGLALAFTPCVLPMVPIVAGIILGDGSTAANRSRAFGLSLAYVLGMAATYTIAGVAFAAAGQQAQTLFQQPWIIALFAALFVAMSLSMFGLFTVQMPSFVQTRLTELSNRQQGGRIAGVVAMGALSSLIVTTCVGPALVAALTVIGQSGQMARGGLALFSMAIGMGVPLLVVGASAGKLLPKAGPWMDTVKQVMGAMMLGVAVWMLSRVVPERVAFALWLVPVGALIAVLVFSSARSRGGRIVARFAATMVAVYAVLLGVGLIKGATDPLRPLQAAAPHASLPFERIKTLDDLNARIAAASAGGKSVMLDFYADWCVSCKEMEKYTFPQDPVREALSNTVWLQADVTANDEADQQLLKHFGIFGPPTIAFYGSDGQERRNYRVVGFMKADEFGPLAAQAVAVAVASTVEAR
ncbi:MAG: protein-disulfide reductase DsbD [Nevskiaceae bacterium]|nr:protein-disulfide reductase DsbD [Nevskiaceae bacterium]